MKIICIGRNYAAHAEELNHLIRGGAEDPAERSRQAGGGAEYPSGLRQIGSATECTAEQPRLNRNATGCTAAQSWLDGGNTGCTAEPSSQAGDGAETLPERNRPGCGEYSPEPIWFLKPDTALLRNNDPFYIPAFSQEVHYECELVVRIDRVGKSIAERFAHRYYKEVGLGIDFTARDLQRQAAAEGLPWERSKAFDRSAAISPEFVSLQELGGDVQKLRFTLEVNGQTRQRGDTSGMLFSVDRIIASVSQYMTLRMGDLLYTGTPAGVEPVRPGDNLRAVLEGRELLNFDIR